MVVGCSARRDSVCRAGHSGHRRLEQLGSARAPPLAFEGPCPARSAGCRRCRRDTPGHHRRALGGGAAGLARLTDRRAAKPSAPVYSLAPQTLLLSAPASDALGRDLDRHWLGLCGHPLGGLVRRLLRAIAARLLDADPDVLAPPLGPLDQPSSTACHKPDLAPKVRVYLDGR